ncbi:NAD-binding protein [Natronobacterium gregoryi]|uniref:Kef-type K+ transport system, predicted NAD-binding component n=2 Tax=Natronobacterium gregoryi TaxID=44930 RepID=L0ALQ7_NATGS|nr:NAD-binding protein [Natronobacterium gregoryi]AFZ74092.1 Kef-type K+ transport system, predicted NAD-binding component [Natronobacterium gregoryi SP2]ELY70300.1 sodium/hydrogen exchanger [Natronobacterium gregoryi SP2]PLK18631.1 potassium transporter Kef [Natronobacterium gregoryi SP2]SFJ61897.1 monovalent cation:H+ antiporter-2, CPA2 family [Natronobacterium gregoryi]
MTDLLTAVAIIFLAAGPFLLVANRLELPTVPFLVLAGIVAGGFIDDTNLLLELAYYGIALLVFTFGTRIDLSGVRTVLADGEFAALGQILVVGSLGVGFGIVLGVPPMEAVYLGIAAALSSTIVGTALLQRTVNSDPVRGRLVRSIQFVQDLLAILFILLLGAGSLEIGYVGPALAAGVALLLGAVFVNRYLFDFIGQLAGDSDELMILGVVALLTVFVGAAEFAGISIVVGAFAAGLAVRYDPVDYLGLFNGLQSIRDFFVAIFFVTIGALVVFPFVGDITWAASIEKLVLVVGLVVLTAVVKPVLTTVILVARGYEARSATLASLHTDQVSEFALIIAIQAVVLDAVSQAVFDAIILAAAITMVTSSLTHRYDEQIYRTLADRGVITGRHDRIDKWSDVPADLADHVIIVGYGRQGRTLVEACEEMGHPYVVIENDPARREEITRECEAVVVGDAMETYTWEKANAADAKLVVSTVNSQPVSRRILSLDTDAEATLRASDRATALELLDEGALYVGQPDLLAGQQLTQQVRELLDGDLTRKDLREQQRAELERRADYVPLHLR